MRLFDWCVLVLKTEHIGNIVFCPSEEIADSIMERCDGFLAVKYPTRRLRDR